MSVPAHPSPPDGVIKVCACGRTYTREQWEQLPAKAVYKLEWGAVHEQRRCACRSHIVLVLDPGEPDPAPKQCWYFRGTGRSIEVVSLTEGTEGTLPLVVYRAGVQRYTVTIVDFWATFTTCLGAQ